MTLRTLGLIASLALAILAPPRSTGAQAPRKVPRVGYVFGQTSSEGRHHLEAFRQGLRELGYVEGQTITLDGRWAEGRAERFPDLVADLVRLKVDVLVVSSTQGGLAAKEATTTIPVVMVGVGDPGGAAWWPTWRGPAGT